MAAYAAILLRWSALTADKLFWRGKHSLPELHSQICLHFCHWQKLTFASVEPSAATLTRVATDLSNLAAAKKSPEAIRPRVIFGAASQI